MMPVAALAAGRPAAHAAGMREFPSDAGAGLPSVLYVDDDAVPGGDGRSWASAYNDLQDAITDAELSGGAVVEIRVAGGVYVPTQLDDPGDPRTATFHLLNGVAVRGGYAGAGSPDFNSRDFVAYPSILSGDLAGNDVGGPDDPSYDENAYRVVSSIALSRAQLRTLDGFVVAGSGGAGMRIERSENIIRDCAFSMNRGRGVSCGIESFPIFERCTFIGNTGGGASFGRDSRPTLLNCLVRDNRADVGGGLYVFQAVPINVRDSVILGNEAVNEGGGIFVADSFVYVDNSTLVDNVAKMGGGLYSYNQVYYDTNRFTNSVIWGNDAEMGKQFALESFSPGPPGQGDTLQLMHCLLGGGSEGVRHLDHGGRPWSIDIQGCFDADPKFVAGVSGGFHLSPQSPCIDKGDVNFVPAPYETDIDGDRRVLSGRVDIGADEFVPARKFLSRSNRPVK